MAATFDPSSGLARSSVWVGARPLADAVEGPAPPLALLAPESLGPALARASLGTVRATVELLLRALGRPGDFDPAPVAPEDLAVPTRGRLLSATRPGWPPFSHSFAAEFPPARLPSLDRRWGSRQPLLAQRQEGEGLRAAGVLGCGPARGR